MELGDFKNSKSHLLEALKIEPENVKILSNLGILSMKTGQHEEAAAYFKRVVEHHPEDPLALRYLEILS
jgi:Flp pilus assembly protein TadD